jgi:hypothetical protein
MTSPDLDAFDSGPLTVERREAAKVRVIAAARAYLLANDRYASVLSCTEVDAQFDLRDAIAALDAVGTADEVKP